MKPELGDALGYLNQVVGDPREGLPEEVFRFASTIVPMVNVDLLIKNKQGETLLTWRDDGFFPPGWHVPGGIIRYKETFHQRLEAVAANELGTRVKFTNKPIAINEIIMEPSWRVRGHFISLLYECILIEPPTVAQAMHDKTPKAGEWAWHVCCPDNILPVHEIYRQFM
jgi:colanic acid biosynthesis protein WcaH